MNPVRWISGTLPGRQQTVARAELYALYMAVLHTEGDLVVVSDNKGVVIRAKDVLAGLPVGPRGAHADLWKSFQRAAEGRTIGVRWVPSHRSKEAVVQGIISDDDRIGNAGADEKGDGGVGSPTGRGCEAGCPS